MDDEQEKYICHLCLKLFHSSKALYGHVRIHDPPENTTSKEVDMNKKKKKKVSFNNNLIVIYYCSFCERNFPSNKSLYGHMRIHSDSFKEINHLQLHSDLRAGPEEVEVYDPDIHDAVEALLMLTDTFTNKSSPSPSPSPRRLHHCRKCKKTFQSGQALEGHMRVHLTRGETSQTQTNPVGIIHPPRFDLNEPPPKTEEEEKL
ncbi:zinc finger protein ZAT5-like [Impatiens glandulifera]|uniref:zinc finger protein ZAT5-like n=1 Tax=Impatiens glandulifera TaxID=253017 RepID=UPI001FB0D55F|nr:zinc finger protein ZAT5-like [Impatiens glandulifera]